MMAVIRENGVVMGRHLKAIEQGFARKSRHELAAILKKLTAESEDAVEKIVAIMNESKDDRLVLSAASKLLDMQRQIALDINNDNMQRLIANVKFGGPRQLSVEDDDTPKINFTDIIDA